MRSIPRSDLLWKSKKSDLARRVESSEELHDQTALPGHMQVTEATHDTDERILHEVLSLLAISGQEVRQGKRPCRVPPVELLNGPAPAVGPLGPASCSSPTRCSRSESLPARQGLIREQGGSRVPS